MAQDVGERVGDWRGWLTQTDQHLVAQVEDVIDGQPHDAGGGLGVHQDQSGGGAGWRWWAVVGQYPPQQGQPPGLGQPLTGTDVEGGQGQIRHVVSGDGPGQEHPRGTFVVLGRLRAPGVEVGLGAVAQPPVVLVEPGQEPFGLSELLGGEPTGGLGQWPGASAGTSRGTWCQRPNWRSSR